MPYVSLFAASRRSREPLGQSEAGSARIIADALVTESVMRRRTGPDLLTISRPGYFDRVGRGWNATTAFTGTYPAQALKQRAVRVLGRATSLGHG